MKNLKLLTLAFFSILMFNYCSDPCKDIDCNGGNCDEGICECLEGLSGTNCETEDRAKFFGTFEGPLDCEGLIDLSNFGFATLTLIVEADPDDILKVKLFTPSLPFTIVDEAQLVGDKLVIPTSQQELDLSIIPEIPIDNITVTTNGDGMLLSADQMEVTVNFIVPLAGTTSCTSVLTRL